MKALFRTIALAIAVPTAATAAPALPTPNGAALPGPARPPENERVETKNTLVDFADSAEPGRWGSVHDVVMGGVSRGGLARASDTTGVFAGVLSLENNGGFASVRRALPANLSGVEALVLEVRGDGRPYQFRIRTDDGFDGVAYRATFETERDEWIRVVLAPAGFRPTFRGRAVPDAPALDLANVRQISFLLADGKPGPFRLEIRRIVAGGFDDGG